MSFLALIATSLIEWFLEKSTSLIPAWIKEYKQVEADNAVSTDEKNKLEQAKTPEDFQNASSVIASDVKSSTK